MQRFASSPIDKERLTIVECEGTGALVAHYNPKEIQIEKQVAWSDDGFGLTYSGEVHGRKVTLELFLDCYEETGADLIAELELLHRLTLPVDAESSESLKRCPPMVRVSKLPFPGASYVIEAVSIKITMFRESNNRTRGFKTDTPNHPVRATATITLKEVTLDRRGEPRRMFTSKKAR